MLHLDAFVPSDRVDQIRDQLDALPSVRHTVVGGATSDGLVSLSAQVDPLHAELAIEVLSKAGLGADAVTLWNVPSMTPLRWRRADGGDAKAWAEVSGRADAHARLASDYMLNMAAAGIIAGVGVLTGSSILVVGAMAISPDLLPISASAVGLVERRWGLAARAARALAIGLSAGAAAAFLATLLLRAMGRIHTDLVLADTVLGPSLTTLGPGTVLVALAAGMAGMLAFERAGGAAVGVAISVTTIPAVAYVGAALALGRANPMAGALLVLVVNVVVIVAASTATLGLQRWRADRDVRRAPPGLVSGS
jgi:uncharacterized hydrophobic protein (TIGR00271 family)